MCRLFNYGVGIHLVQRDDARRAPDVNPGELDPGQPVRFMGLAHINNSNKSQMPISAKRRYTIY